MQTSEPIIRISVREQRLDLISGDALLASYPISTSRFGLGSEEGSMKTPLGKFRIAEKIGADVPSGTIFRSRIPLAPNDEPPPTDDLVLTRILWLDGLEEHNANTRDRFIYIHGTNHEEEIGQPASRGCIRMKNADLIALFDQVPLGAEVVISNLKKGREIRCARWFPRLNSRQQPAKEGGEFIVKFVKMIMIVAVAASVLSLGACAQKKEAPPPPPAPVSAK